MVLKFQNSIMELLRQTRGLQKEDTSEDKYINQYSINQAYKELLVFGNYSDFNVQITPEFIEFCNRRQ